MLEKKDDDIDTYHHSQKDSGSFESSPTSRQQSKARLQNRQQQQTLSKAKPKSSTTKRQSDDIIQSRTLFQSDDHVVDDDNEYDVDDATHDHECEKSNHIPYNELGHHMKEINIDDIQEAVPDLKLIGITQQQQQQQQRTRVKKPQKQTHTKQSQQQRHKTQQKQQPSVDDTATTMTNDEDDGHQANHVPFNTFGHHKEEITIKQLCDIIPDINLVGIPPSTGDKSAKKASASHHPTKASKGKKHKMKKRSKKAKHQPLYLVPKHISGFSRKSNHVRYNEDGQHRNIITLPNLLMANPDIQLVGFPKFKSSRDAKRFINSLPKHERTKMLKQKKRFDQKMAKLQKIFPSHMIPRTLKKNKTIIDVQRRPNQPYEYLIRGGPSQQPPHPDEQISGRSKEVPHYFHRVTGLSKFLKPLQVHEEVAGLNTRMPRDIVEDEFDDPRHRISFANDMNHMIDLTLNSASVQSRQPQRMPRELPLPWHTHGVMAVEPPTPVNQYQLQTTLPSRPEYIYHPMRSWHAKQLEKDELVQSLVSEGKLALPNVIRPAQHSYRYNNDRYSKVTLKRDGRGSQYNFGSIYDDIDDILDAQEGRRQQQLIQEEQDYYMNHQAKGRAPPVSTLREVNYTEGPTRPIIDVKPSLKTRYQTMPPPTRHVQGQEGYAPEGFQEPKPTGKTSAPFKEEQYNPLGKSSIYGTITPQLASQIYSHPYMHSTRRNLESNYPPRAALKLSEFIDDMPAQVSKSSQSKMPSSQSTKAQQQQEQKPTTTTTTTSSTSKRSQASSSKSSSSTTEDKVSELLDQDQDQSSTNIRQQLSQILTNDFIFSIVDEDLLMAMKSSPHVDRKIKRKVYWRLNNLRTDDTQSPSYGGKQFQQQQQYQQQPHYHQQPYGHQFQQNGNMFYPMPGVMHTLFHQPLSPYSYHFPYNPMYSHAHMMPMSHKDHHLYNYQQQYDQHQQQYNQHHQQQQQQYSQQPRQHQQQRQQQDKQRKFAKQQQQPQQQQQQQQPQQHQQQRKSQQRFTDDQKEQGFA